MMVFFSEREGRNEQWLAVARGWLWLAVAAMGFSALLAILLVLSRMPHLQGLPGLNAMFHTVLVLHVNFAVMIWLLAFAGLLWARARRDVTLVDQLALMFAVCGALLLVAAPFSSNAVAVLSNYIPVLDSPLFLSGLALFTLSITLQSLRGLAAPFAGVELRMAALTWLALVAMLVVTLLQLGSLQQLAYEHLFWGAGHLLQFVYLLLLVAAWQRSAGEGITIALPTPLLVIAAALLLALLFHPASAASHRGYTLLMQLGAPLLLLPLLWRLIPALRRIRDTALSGSVVLLVAGLFIGLLINGDTVMVTAHYHATNAAITLALMGYGYRLLPQLGFAAVAAPLARWQLRLYGSGMALYVAGMAASGWLGVARKSADVVEESAQLTMAVMGFGGLAAVAATLLFVTVMARAMARRTVPTLHKAVGELL